MPAKPKYLSSGWTQFNKVIACIFGAYLATMMLHLALASSVADDTPVLLTSTYTAFFCWIGLMVMVYMIRRAWLAWLILLGITGISSLFVFL